MNSFLQVLTTLLCLVAVSLGQKDIRMPPSIQPSNVDSYILYKIDIEVVLPCKAIGSPQPRYEWYFNGESLDLNARNLQASPDPADGKLTIKTITSLDEGYYQCRAINIYGVSVSKVYFLQRALFGTYPPTSIQNYTVKEGMPLRIKCFEIKSIPKPSYSWALVKTTVDENPVSLINNVRIIKDDDGNLYFSYVTKSDARVVVGETYPSLLYKCNVFNSHLDFLRGGSYSRIIVEDGEAVDSKPTTLYVTPSPYYVVKGEQLRIQCIFAGKPEVKVTWDPMPGGRGDTDELDTVLVINNVKFEDAGRYTCTGRNNVGYEEESIQVVVQSKPEFVRQPINVNATEGETVSIECSTESNTQPPAEIQWYINGDAVNADNPGPRTEISDGGHRMTIRNLCKDCPSGTSDLKVVQCNASNVHGYVFADGYINVLLATVIFTAPEDLTIDPDSTLAVFNCQADSDQSTPVSYSWTRDDKSLSYYQDERMQTNDSTNGISLMIDLSGLELEAKKKYEGVYKCIASNRYSTVEENAQLTIDDGGVIPVVAEAGKMWWIFLIIALILLLLILLLCCCICLQRNRGEAYPVDEKERQQGNDPEKELADSGFHDFHRPEDEPVKGSRASLTSTIKLDSDDEGSLAEYGDIDTGKFNEDGSFIGQYMTDKKKKQSNV